MYLWRIEGLKAQLAVAPLTDREILPYVVVNGAACALVFAAHPENPNGWDTALGFLNLPGIILGILWVYRQNGGRAGTNFLQRYTAIGWVAFLRLLPVILIGSLALYLAKGAPLGATFETSGIDVLFGLGVLVVYFLSTGRHVRQIAGSLPHKQMRPTIGGRTE